MRLVASLKFSRLDRPSPRVPAQTRLGLRAQWCRALAVACFALAAAARSSSAQTLEALRLQTDNDYFDFWLPQHDRPDNQYTHGQIVRALLNVAPSWARGGRPVHDSPTPVEGDRPYAGSLVAEAGRQIVDRRNAASISVRIGTTGYPSGAAAAQKAFHRLTYQRRPLGWRYQVAAQPIIGLTYGRQYLVTPWSVRRATTVALIAGATAIATTAQSNLTANLELKTGLRLPHPWMPSRAAVEKRFRVYLIAGAAEQWIARDLLLEGNSSYTSGLVTKRPFVFQSVWGIGGGAGDYFFEYRVVSRGRDFETGPGWHRWGTITLIRGRP
jgi:hypothetical protein